MGRVFGGTVYLFRCSPFFSLEGGVAPSLTVAIVGVVIIIYFLLLMMMMMVVGRFASAVVVSFSYRLRPKRSSL